MGSRDGAVVRVLSPNRWHKCDSNPFKPIKSVAGFCLALRVFLGTAAVLLPPEKPKFQSPI